MLSCEAEDYLQNLGQALIRLAGAYDCMPDSPVSILIKAFIRWK